MVEFNKLVRDNIPDIIRSQGEIPNVSILSNECYLTALDKKLNEEVREYQQSNDLEELADILEVIYAICEARGYSIEKLNDIREQKRRTKGSFSKKYYLISKE